MNRNKVGYSLAPFGLLILAACGDSGDDGDSTVKYVPLAITESNAKAVTKEVVGSPESLDTQSGMNIISSVIPKSAPVQKALAQLADDVDGSARFSQTQQCDGGGSITVAADSTETKVVYTANDCRYSVDTGSQQMALRLDGKMTMIRQDPSGFPPRENFPVDSGWDTIPLNFSEKVQWQWYFNSFVIQIEGNGNTSITYDGDMQIKAGINDTSGPAYAAIGSNSLSIHAIDTANSTNINLALSGLSLESVSHTNYGPAFAEMIYNTTYGSSSLAGVGGQVTVMTLDNLIYDKGTADSMESGKLKITGADNSSVVVTVPGRLSDVQLDIDSNGDGATDLVQDLSWAELGAENTTELL